MGDGVAYTLFLAVVAAGPFISGVKNQTEQTALYTVKIEDFSWPITWPMLTALAAGLVSATGLFAAVRLDQYATFTLIAALVPLGALLTVARLEQRLIAMAIFALAAVIGLVWTWQVTLLGKVFYASMAVDTTTTQTYMVVVVASIALFALFGQVAARGANRPWAWLVLSALSPSAIVFAANGHDQIAG